MCITSAVTRAREHVSASSNRVTASVVLTGICMHMQAAEPDRAQEGAAGQAGAEPAGEGGFEDGGAGHVQDQLPGPSHHCLMVQA